MNQWILLQSKIASEPANRTRYWFWGESKPICSDKVANNIANALLYCHLSDDTLIESTVLLGYVLYYFSNNSELEDEILDQLEDIIHQQRCEGNLFNNCIEGRSSKSLKVRI